MVQNFNSQEKQLSLNSYLKQNIDSSINVQCHWCSHILIDRIKIFLSFYTRVLYYSFTIKRVSHRNSRTMTECRKYETCAVRSSWLLQKSRSFQKLDNWFIWRYLNISISSYSHTFGTALMWNHSKYFLVNVKPKAAYAVGQLIINEAINLEL